MRKLFLIARSNFRKSKGQTVAIVVLVLLAALMLNLWLMLSMDYHANFERYHEKLNAEHVTVVADQDSGEFYEFMTQKLGGDPLVTEHRLDRCMHTVGVFSYNGGDINNEFVFLDRQTAFNRTIGKIEIVEDGGLSSGIYLPMLYRSKEIAVGEEMQISIGNHTAEYNVCGFFNSVMLGSHNCGLTEIVLTEDCYERLTELNFAPQATLCSVRLTEGTNTLNYEAELKADISERFPNIGMASNSYSIVSQSRYISQMICTGILSAMAFLVLLISLVVIVSNIINYIQVDIKNLGALKAVGYTSGQLICVLLLQFCSLSFLTAIAGAGLSYCLFPALNEMMISQTGIPYAIRFLPLPFFLSLILLCGTVAFTVWIASRRIKKIEPIVALRSGVQTHNFKRNHVPLEKTKAPLNLALALKTTFSGVKHNVTVCITMLVLSLVVAFSGLMTENVIADMTPFLNLIVGETADSCVNVQAEAEEELLQALNSDRRVEKVYLYNSLTVSHVGGAELMATLCDDFSKVNNQAVVFKGRFPKYDNEIAIAAKYAREKGFAVGNEMEITSNGKKLKYIISGFTQITNNLGRDCLLTRQGYERLGELSNVSYYINLEEGTDINVFNAEISERFSGSVNATINIDETIRGASSVYVTLMTIIVIAVLVLSAIIIAFVLYLLVRTMLNNKRRDYGILKSFGFTTRQLILQTAFSFMPAMIVSTVIGLIISCVIINPLTAVFLNPLGIVKCTFGVPIGFVAMAGLGLLGVAFGIACLLSLKIKKISPHALLCGE